ncbi:HAD-like domain-containing protein [Rhodocollybia butyracea]|uniref:HAD-like domain-containing protein n=1 Tax=Rhodocollybia butyracea TaxID=206335 RepID=A0A9P5PPZ6_9AGAR|nr:HAD-like domain-containing protein [Rhodocollybia butyracea]
MPVSGLEHVEALIFDVLGTVVDWRSSVTNELEDLGKKYSLPDTAKDWLDFANEWRTGYIDTARRIARGARGHQNLDVLHREILESLLSSPRWTHVGKVLDEDARAHLNLVWHRLKGWPDAVQGLYELKKQVILATLSNGNLRLLVDMAKYADLPWDVVFSSDMFGPYKPNPITYQGALTHLSLSDEPYKVAFVASHMFDLRAAQKLGMKTIYVPRLNEEWDELDGEVKIKADGGEVDVVVGDFVELAKLFVK